MKLGGLAHNYGRSPIAWLLTCLHATNFVMAIVNTSRPHRVWLDSCIGTGGRPLRSWPADPSILTTGRSPSNS